MPRVGYKHNSDVNMFHVLFAIKQPHQSIAFLIKYLSHTSIKRPYISDNTKNALETQKYVLGR